MGHANGARSQRNRRIIGNRAIAIAVAGAGALSLVQLVHASDIYLATDSGSGATQTGTGGVGVDGGYWFDPNNWKASNGGVPDNSQAATRNNGTAYTVNVNAPVATLPVLGLVYDPANDPNAPSTNYADVVTQLYISSLDTTNTFSGGVSPNTLTVDSGSLEVLGTILDGRATTGIIVQNGGTVYADQYLESAIKYTSGVAGSGNYYYNGGNFFAGINSSGNYYANNTGGIRLGSTSTNNVTGGFIVSNAGAIGQVNVSDFTSPQQETGGAGVVGFIYDGNNNVVGGAGGGGVRPIQITGTASQFANNTGGTAFNNGVLGLATQFASQGGAQTQLNLTLHAAPSVSVGGAPQSLALFTYTNGIAGYDTSNFYTGSSMTNVVPEGGAVTASFNGITYTWDLYYDGSVSFSNSATSQISSISQTGGSTLTGTVGQGAGAVVLIGVSSTGTANGVWTNASGSNWSGTGNWSNSYVPQNEYDIATFGGNVSANSTVTLDANETVSSVIFNNTAHSYTIAPGGGSLILNYGLTAARITDNGGSHTLAVPVILTAGVAATAANPTDSLLISGAISGPGGLTSQGSGAVELTGANSYTGGTTAASGKLIIGASGALPLGALTVGTSSATPAVVQLASNVGPITQTSVSVATGSTLDITNNRVVINYGSPANDPIAAIAAAIASGAANNGSESLWTGTGITSSTAVGSNGKYSVGYLDGNLASDNSTNNPIAQNQIILQYTLTGDAFLEGTVGFDDLLTVAQNYGSTGKDWAQGNFQYDPQGSVGFSDLLSVAQSYGSSVGGGALAGSVGGGVLSLAWQSSSTAVPEPTGIAFVAGAAALLARRRKAKNRPA